MTKIKNLTEIEQYHIKNITGDCNYYHSIPEHELTDAVLIAIISSDKRAIKKLKNIPYHVLLEVCRSNGYNIQYIDHSLQTPELCETAVEYASYAFPYCKYVTNNMLDTMFSIYRASVRDVPYPYLTEERCMQAVETDINFLTGMLIPYESCIRHSVDQWRLYGMDAYCYSSNINGTIENNLIAVDEYKKSVGTKAYEHLRTENITEDLIAEYVLENGVTYFSLMAIERINAIDNYNETS